MFDVIDVVINQTQLAPQLRSSLERHSLLVKMSSSYNYEVASWNGSPRVSVIPRTRTTIRNGTQFLYVSSVSALKWSFQGLGGVSFSFQGGGSRFHRMMCVIQFLMTRRIEEVFNVVLPQRSLAMCWDAMMFGAFLEHVGLNGETSKKSK